MAPGLTEKPSKHKKKNIDNNNNNIVEAPKKPTARRHLLLIRHGQYNMDADSDIGRKLTELGRVIWMGQLIIFDLFINQSVVWDVILSPLSTPTRMKACDLRRCSISGIIISSSSPLSCLLLSMHLIIGLPFDVYFSRPYSSSGSPYFLHPSP